MSESTAEVSEKTPPIKVPEGKFSAPNDYEIRTVNLELRGRQQNLELVKQTFSGNCAEYTALNTAILLSTAGIAINPAIEMYLNSNPTLDLTSVETELTIPLILNGQEEYLSIRTDVNDVDNLVDKHRNPYEPLTNANSALLFRMAVSPQKQDFKNEEFIQGDPAPLLEKLSSEEISAIFVGSVNHARSWVKLSDKYYHIDPYFNENIISEVTKEKMEADVAKLMKEPNSFATVNSLSTK